MLPGLFQSGQYAFSSYAIPTFATTLILLGLGLLVLYRERASRVSVLFFLVTQTIGLWLFAFSWMYCAVDERVALWWAKTAYLGVPFIPAAIYHFTLAVLGISPRSRTIPAVWTISALFSLCAVSTDTLVGGLYRYWWGYYPRYGWVGLPFIGYFFALMVASLRHYWVEYRRSVSEIRKTRIKWFMLAFAGAYIASLDYLAKYGVPLYPFGYLAVVCWLVFVERAIWRYQLVTITPAFAAEQILTTMADALLVFDQEGIVRVANRAAEHLFGASGRDLIGQPIWGVHPEFFSKDKLETLMRVGTLRGARLDYPRVQGDMAALEISASVIRDRAGQGAAVVCIARDVTERQLAEDALRASEERFRSVAQSANDAIVSTDRRGRILFWNNGAERIFGYQQDEMIGKSLTLLMPERYREAHRAGLERLSETGEGRIIGKTLELHGLRKNGAEFPLELSLAMWRTGGEIFYGGIIRDITERKQAEQALRRSEEQLRQAQKMEAVGRLAGGVAHDFNNLLTVIKGHSALLLHQINQDSPVRDEIAEIQKAGERAAALTRQLLTFSRKHIVQPKILDLSDVISNLHGILKRLIGEDVDLVVELWKPLGNVRIDPSQLEQVILNLAVNARDAMPQGGRLTIQGTSVELQHSDARFRLPVPSGRYVMLAVSDSGHGMDREVQSHLFEPFFTTKEPGKGTGLGLSTVYGIVKQSGGGLAVESEPGNGSTFRIYLPEIDEPITPVELVASMKDLARGKETVLLAEDEQMVRELAATTLESCGYRVLQAKDGAEALRTSQEFTGPIDVLVTDVIMPGMNGRVLAQVLDAARPGIKVLYMSGYTDDAVVIHGLMNAGLAFLQKPFFPAELARKVRSVLDQAP